MPDQTQTPGLTRWQKKPLTVSMIRWDGSDSARQLIDSHAKCGVGSLVKHDGSLSMWAAKSRAFVILNPGDWAAVELDGSGVYPITEEDREAGYEPAPPHPVTTSWLRSQIAAVLEKWLLGETPPAPLESATDAVMTVLEPAIGRITAETAALVRAEMAPGSRFEPGELDD